MDNVNSKQETIAAAEVAVKAEKRKIKLRWQLYAYIVLVALSVAAFIFPLMQTASEDGQVSLQLSFGGFDTLSFASSARAGLLVLLCAVLSVVAAATHILAEVARQKRNKKLKKIALWARLSICGLFAIMFIYCAAGMINHFTSLVKSAAVNADESLSAGLFVMLATALIAIGVFVSDGMNALERILAKSAQVEKGRFGMIITMFTAAYAALIALLWLSLSFPYGSLEFTEGIKTRFYIFPHSGERIFDILPSTKALFVFAVTMLAAAAAMVTTHVIWGRNFLNKNKKTGEVLCFYVKPALAAAVTGLFVGQFEGIAQYAAYLEANKSVIDSGLTVGSARILITFAVIGLLAVVWLDVLMSLRIHLGVRAKGKKGQ